MITKLAYQIINRHLEAQRILREVKRGNFSFSLHAGQRSLMRALSKEQIIRASENLIYWKWQDDHETYLFVGRLVDGNGAGFTAVIEKNVVIVTVFRRRLKRWEWRKDRA